MGQLERVQEATDDGTDGDGATAAFPAWELTPSSRWNYALCLDEQSLTRLVQIRWHSPSTTLFDPAHPFVTLHVPARTVRGWTLRQRSVIFQKSIWVSRGKWRSGKRRIKDQFAFTPPLPGVTSLQARLSQDVEWIELVPYGTTLLRLTVFPQAPTLAE